ncbi:hypothetical protein ABH931_001610 [Streptacidiphilus sp. MAP12-33]|uniref:hypothetical protein n=1 Tax=Streptacidiphilus sp. MAP12-33 TaxID=3156266 RepID=UPI0035145C47
MRLRTSMPAPTLAAACALTAAAAVLVAVPTASAAQPARSQGVRVDAGAANHAAPPSGGLSWSFYTYLQAGHPLPFDVTGFSQDKAPIMACVRYQQTYGPTWHTLGCTKPDVYKTKGQIRVGFPHTGYYGIGVELLERVHGAWLRVADTYGNPLVTVVGTKPVKNPKAVQRGTGSPRDLIYPQPENGNTDVGAARPADWNTMVPESVTPADVSGQQF